MSACQAVSLGLTDFAWAEALQDRLVAARTRGEMPDTILLTSHRPVITVGRSGGREDLRASHQALAARGIDVRMARRGGRATYHGPGQLIVYPILHLKSLRPDVHWYIGALERAVVVTLADLGIAATAREGHRGVWVAGRKIASIGIAIRRWVTSHGVALNVADDLADFDAIVPCGIHGVRMTSIEAETGRVPNPETLQNALVAHLGEELGIHVTFRTRRAVTGLAAHGTKRPWQAIVGPNGGPALA